MKFINHRHVIAIDYISMIDSLHDIAAFLKNFYYIGIFKTLPSFF